MATKPLENNPEGRAVSPLNGQPVPPPAWKPGESGNPGGRPKNTPIADAYRKFVAMDIETFKKIKPEKLTVAEGVARQQVMKALKGALNSLVEATNRSEGPVPTRLEGPDGSALTAPTEIVIARIEDLLIAARGRLK